MVHIRDAAYGRDRPHKPLVVVVGSANTDLVVRVPRLPCPGETVLGSDMARVAGGKGANQAVAAVRLGARVCLIARVGMDDFGEQALRSLDGEGVDRQFVGRDPTTPSGIALIGVEEATGENAIIVSPGANGRLTAEDVRRAQAELESASVVLCQMEVPPEAIEEALAIGKLAGAVTILNPAPAAPLTAAMVASVSVLTPNESEAAVIAGRPGEAESLAQELCVLGPQSVVITLGARGALVAAAVKTRHIAGFAVSHVVDTTAAGDCFNGALAVALAEGKDLDEAVHFAQAAAALSVTRAGAQASLPYRAEVEEFIKNGSIS